MKKSEIISALNDLANRNADAHSAIDDAKDALRRIESLLEDMPQDASEIEEDDKEEEEED